MKTLLYIILFAFTTIACVPSGNVSSDKPKTPNLLNQQNGDGVEYDLIIIDPGFQGWFAKHAKPITYYTPEYYKQWNQRYVTAWNEKVGQAASYRSADYPFENRIDYDSTADYGPQLNYELYWYFRYIQSLYGNLYNFPGPGYQRGDL